MDINKEDTKVTEKSEIRLMLTTQIESYIQSDEFKSKVQEKAKGIATELLRQVVSEIKNMDITVPNTYPNFAGTPGTTLPYNPNGGVLLRSTIAEPESFKGGYNVMTDSHPSVYSGEIKG